MNISARSRISKQSQIETLELNNTMPETKKKENFKGWAQQQNGGTRNNL